MPVVKVVGWMPGVLTISLIKLVREATGSDLAQAKSMVDELLEGKSFEVTFTDVEAAESFAGRAEAIGARVISIGGR